MALFLAPLAAQVTPGSGASTNGRTAPKPKLETKILDLTQLDSIPGLPAATVVAYPRLCSSDGEIFSLVYATSASDKVSTIPDVYGVSAQRAVRHLTVPLPQNFKYRSVRSFFPGKFSAVFLVQAAQPEGIAAEVDPTRRQFFLARTDRDGDSPEIVKLELPFEPIKLGVFDTGDILALGSNTANLYPVLALLHSDGSLSRILNFDDRLYQAAILTGGAYVQHPDDSNTAARQRLVLGSLAKAQLIPWGSEILLIQPGSNLPVYRVSAGGLVREVKLSAPEGFLLQTIEGAGSGDTWLAVMQDINSFVKVDTGKVAENPPQRLFEIDPFTGKTLRVFDVKGPQVGEVACGSNHKASAIYYGQPSRPDAPNQLMYASAPR